MHRTRSLACLVAAALALSASVVPAAPAQPARPGGGQTGFVPDPVDMAAAKREGTVTWYTSTPIETAQKIAKMFEEQTGIKVQLFRSGGTATLRRFLQEVDAGRILADVLTISDPAAYSMLAKRDLLVPFKPKNFDKVPDSLKDPQGRFIAQRLNMLGMVARTDKGIELPKNWTDLTDPKYKGKMVMPDPSFTANMLMVVSVLSQKYGWRYYQQLRANDVMIVQGHQQVSDTLTSGERWIAAEGEGSYTWKDQQAGHKVVFIIPTDGAVAVPAPTAVIKGSPHPNAAKALAEFMISDAVQKFFPGEGNYAARVDIEPPAGQPPLSQIKLLPVDYEYVEREATNIKNRFAEIFQR
ncbi:MAG TPA: extracellular solute-binding protein [Thermodesulfobacteriota bacterium]|nr:extracellular solute-binding protein [Thermodesulfobacteriota bacterium]